MVGATCQCAGYTQVPYMMKSVGLFTKNNPINCTLKWKTNQVNQCLLPPIHSSPCLFVKLHSKVQSPDFSLGTRSLLCFPPSQQQEQDQQEEEEEPPPKSI